VSATTQSSCTAPSKPTSLTATSVSSSEIDLSWSSVSGAIGYDISYCDGTYIAFSSSASYKHTGRASSTNYSYKIQAQKSATCVSGYSSCVSATTQSSCTPPAKPAGLTATAVSSSQINLSWNAVAGAIGYDVSYCDGTYIGFVSGTTYSHTGRVENINYSYKVQAQKSATCVSGYTTCASATTPSSCILPAKPTGLTSTAVSSSQINLSWNAVAGAIGYDVSYCDGTYIQFVSGTTYSHTGRVENINYSYKVQAQKSATCVSGYTTCASATTPNSCTPPAKPAGLTAIAVSSSQINLSWNAVAGAIGYDISYCDGTYIGFTSSTSYSHTGRVENMDYSYKVQAQKSATCVSGYTTCASATTPSSCTPPAKPVGLIATAVSSSQINLSWNAVAGAIGYDVSYCDGTYIQFVSGTTYSHTGRVENMDYSYKVQAQKSATCVSGFTTCASAKTLSSCTPPAKPTGLTATAASSSQINLSWNAVTGAIGYDVSYCDGTYIGFVSGTAYSHTGRVENINYSYKVQAQIRATCVSGYTTCASATTPSSCTPPAKPTGLTATTVSASEIDLSWSPVSGAIGYDISYCDGNYIAFSSGTTYKHIGRASGIDYSYKIQAQKSATCVSGYTSCVIARTLSSNSHILEVPFYPQESTNWCWAASTSMILKYYGFNRKIWEIAADFDKPKDIGLSPYFVNGYKNYLETYYGDGSNNCWNSEVFIDNNNFKNKLISILSSGIPVIVMSIDIKHAFIVTGYTGEEANDFVYFHDSDNVFDKTQKERINMHLSWKDFMTFIDNSFSFLYDMKVFYPNAGHLQKNSGKISFQINPGGIYFSNSYGLTDSKNKRWINLDWDGVPPYDGYKYIQGQQVDPWYPIDNKLGYKATQADILEIVPFISNSSFPKTPIGCKVMIDILNNAGNIVISRQSENMQIPGQTKLDGDIYSLQLNSDIELKNLAPGNYQGRLRLVNTSTNVVEDEMSVKFDVAASEYASFSAECLSPTNSKIPKESVGIWQFRIRNNGSLPDQFNLTSSGGAFYFEGKQIQTTPQINSGAELVFDFRFSSTNLAVGSTGTINTILYSANDPSKLAEFVQTYSVTSSIVAKPSLTTRAVSALTSTTVSAGGNFISDGGATILAKGICWSTGMNPTIGNSKTLDGTGTVSFTSNIAGLTAGTTYHIRAYATNSVDTGYGQDIAFTTSIVAVAPKLNTANSIATSATTASSGGTIISDGGATITAKGVCWSISTNPTIGNSKTTDGTGTIAFTSNISGLTAGLTYHIRAYATNNVDTGYGEDIQITTPTIAVVPTVTTNSVIGTSSSTTSCGGIIISDGGATIISKGLCWNTDVNPTIANSKTFDGDGTIAFSSNITDLKAGLTYHVRAYAINSVGPGYGEDKVFTTKEENFLFANFSTALVSACSPLTINFIDESSGSPTTWAWDIDNDGITDYTDESPTYTYSAAGTYSVKLTVTNSAGNTSIKMSDVVINAQSLMPKAPTVGIITQPTCTVATGSLVLSGLPDNEYYTLTRSPDGKTIIDNRTIITIPGLATGTYSFTITNSTGCTSNASVDVVINPNASSPKAPIIEKIAQPTCTLSTGLLMLSGLPIVGTWTLQRTPGSETITGSGASITISGLVAGSYTYAVTDASGCSSGASVNVIINEQPSTPIAPVFGNIMHPTCTLSTGSVVLNGLPASGTWMLTKTPGGETMTGTSTSKTISGLAAGTYAYTVTNSSGCSSSTSVNLIINEQPVIPTVPNAGLITQPTCVLPSGSVVLNGLPATASWTLTKSPGGETTTGIGTNKTIVGLVAGTYTYNVTNASGCTSLASANVVINPFASSPIAPTIGLITHPTCTLTTGSAVLNGLPETGTWTLTENPGGISMSGTGINKTIYGLVAGAYTYTVTNASGCNSIPSANIIINEQPVTPVPPIVGQVTHPTCTLATGNLVLNGLPATGTWTITKTQGGSTTTGSGTSAAIPGLATGISTFTVTNVSGCTSGLSANVVINMQPTIPAGSSSNASTKISQTAFTANWNSSAMATGYRLDIATNTGFTTFVAGYSDKDVGNVTSFDVTGLNANTSYYYRVRAANLCGASVNSGTITSNTLPNPPAATTINRATSIMQTSFNANWNNTATATGYRLDVALDAGFTSFVADLNDKDIGNITTYNVTGLIPHTPYYYRVRAYNSGGTGVSSSSISVTTLSIPPATPTGLASSSCNNLVTLKWKKSTDPYFLRYRIYGGMVNNPTEKIDSSSVAISDTSKIISGLSNGQTYYFRVTAVNNDGPESEFSIQSSAIVKTGVIPKIKVKWGTLLIAYNTDSLITNYQWYLGTTIIQNAIGQYYSAGKQAGIYGVETIDKNTCKNFSNTIPITGVTTKSLTVYPNPTSVSFEIRLIDTSELNNQSDESAIVSVINAAGQKVLEFQAKNANDELLKAIPVSNLTNGVYVVQVLVNKQDMYFTKIVVFK